MVNKCLENFQLVPNVLLYFTLSAIFRIKKGIAIVKVRYRVENGNIQFDVHRTQKIYFKKSIYLKVVGLMVVA